MNPNGYVSANNNTPTAKPQETSVARTQQSEDERTRRQIAEYRSGKRFDTSIETMLSVEEASSDDYHWSPLYMDFTQIENTPHRRFDDLDLSATSDDDGDDDEMEQFRELAHDEYERYVRLERFLSRPYLTEDEYYNRRFAPPDYVSRPTQLCVPSTKLDKKDFAQFNSFSVPLPKPKIDLMAIEKTPPPQGRIDVHAVLTGAVHPPTTNSFTKATPRYIDVTMPTISDAIPHTIANTAVMPRESVPLQGSPLADTVVPQAPPPIQHLPPENLAQETTFVASTAAIEVQEPPAIPDNPPEDVAPHGPPPQDEGENTPGVQKLTKPQKRRARAERELGEPVAEEFSFSGYLVPRPFGGAPIYWSKTEGKFKVAKTRSEHERARQQAEMPREPRRQPGTAPRKSKGNKDKHGFY